MKEPDNISGSWMAALYQLLFTMLLPADERITVLLSHALTWGRLDDAAIAQAEGASAWEATKKGRAMAVLYKAAARAADTSAPTALQMVPIAFTPNPRLSSGHPHADAISSQLLGWAFTDDAGRVVEAIVVNLSSDDRPVMTVAGVFGDAVSGAQLSWTAYDVAAGELLKVDAKMRRTQGTVGSGKAVAVPAFSVLSVSFKESKTKSLRGPFGGARSGHAGVSLRGEFPGKAEPPWF